jgi:hypothetical protein
MEPLQREAVRRLANSSFAVDQIVENFKEMALTPMPVGAEILGFSIQRSKDAAALFECVGHRVTLSAQYAQIRVGKEIAARISFCRVNGKEGLGESLLVATLNANGDVTFPDGDTFDIWPQNDPNPTMFRFHLSCQVLRAIQEALPSA